MSLRSQRAKVTFDSRGFEELFARRSLVSADDAAADNTDVSPGFDVFIDDERYVGRIHEVAVDQHDQPGSVLVGLTTEGGEAVEERFVIVLYEHKDGERESAWTVSNKVFIGDGDDFPDVVWG